MHVKRQVRRVLRATGPHERTAALLPWGLVLGSPLPLGAGLDAFALNMMGLGAGAAAAPAVPRAPSRRRLDRR